MKRLLDLLNESLTVLQLRHWRVRLEFATKEELGKAEMHIVIDRKRNAATIYMRQNLRHASDKTLRPLFLHELLHLHLDQMCLEHYRETPIPPENTDNCFHREMERCTENLAHVIANLVMQGV